MNSAMFGLDSVLLLPEGTGKWKNRDTTADFGHVAYSNHRLQIKCEVAVCTLKTFMQFTASIKLSMLIIITSQYTFIVLVLPPPAHTLLCAGSVKHFLNKSSLWKYSKNRKRTE